MPSTPAAVTAQRTIHARRTRVQRGVPAYATTGGSRSSSGSEGKSEESEVRAGSASHNRFAVLRAQEPAPGAQEGRESMVYLSSGSGPERPSTLPLRTDTLSTEPLSLSEKVKGKPVAQISFATTLSKRSSKSRLASHTPTNSAHNQQPPVPLAATTSSTKPQAQPSPLVLQIDTQAARSLKLSSTSNLTSFESITEAPHSRIISPDSAPSLPEPPMPPDPMADPSLATLPKSPSPDFRYLTSPKYCETINGQFAVPKPTSSDNFYSDDSLHHVVRTIRGKIFWMAPEVAATNERSAVKPVGSILIPGAATKRGEVKGRVDRTKLNRTSGEYVNSREDTESESDEEEGEAEEWLGKDEGFWKQSFDKGSVEEAETQTSGEGDR